MGSTDFSEGDLLKGCIVGDKQNWNLFVQRYSKLIYHTIYKTLRVNDSTANPDDVNDLFQEIFTSLYTDNFKRLRMFDCSKGCSLASWLRMITVRTTIDHLRKHRPLSSLHDLPIEPSQAGPQETIIDEDALQHLREMFEALSAKDKLLVELHYLRELPPEEVTEILHISVEAFYTRKNRIIEKLRKIAKERKIL